jgi:hypothetical protein
MLEQAVQDYGRRIATTVLKTTKVGRNAYDVETTHEVVRITQAADGSITLMGWRKATAQSDPIRRTHILLTGAWFATGGWACSLTTVHDTTYTSLKRGALPRGA